MVNNEEILSKQTKELRETVKRMQVGKQDVQRLKDENDVLTSQNRKLLAELQDTTEDELAKTAMEHRNEKAIIDGPKLSLEEMNARWKAAQDEMVQLGRSHGETQAQLAKEMQVTRDLNAKVKEDYDIPQERFQKHQVLNEKLVGELKQDHEQLGLRCKELERFREKHESIFQAERNESMKTIIKLNQEKESMEKKYSKALDDARTELETL